MKKGGLLIMVGYFVRVAGVTTTGSISEKQVILVGIYVAFYWMAAPLHDTIQFRTATHKET